MDNQQQYTEPLDKERHIDYGFLFKTLLKYKKSPAYTGDFYKKDYSICYL